MWAKNRKHGFTIVELLIVIVVIGILATISIVAYNGVQNRAKNTQVTSAVAAWTKALKLYKIENGSFPPYWTCLGQGYNFGPYDNESSGVGQCRQDAAGSGTKEVTAFNDAMKPYLNGSLPTPPMITARSTDTLWRRGLSFAPTGGDGTLSYITAAYAGDIQCPSISGVESSTRTLWNGNTYCLYTIGHTTDAV